MPEPISARNPPALAPVVATPEVKLLSKVKSATTAPFAAPAKTAADPITKANFAALLRCGRSPNFETIFFIWLVTSFGGVWFFKNSFPASPHHFPSRHDRVTFNFRPVMFPSLYCDLLVTEIWRDHLAPLMPSAKKIFSFVIYSEFHRASYRFEKVIIITLCDFIHIGCFL
ncbi:MAG: hypothetical protein QM796_20150 [Chthoniobacteraceae bacterium]